MLVSQTARAIRSILPQKHHESVTFSDEPQELYAWAVFTLCFFCSAAGVALSFLVMGGTITGYRLWGAGLALAVLMLGISYGAKYANPDARERFAPVDLIQYLSQGFLWPSIWPGLADFIGVEKIEPPLATALLVLGIGN